MDGQVLDTQGHPIHSLSVFASKADHSYMMEIATGSDGQFSMTDCRQARIRSLRRMKPRLNPGM
jgi:hypothetical protein